MKKIKEEEKPSIWFITGIITFMALVLVIAIIVVVTEYNKNKPIKPNQSLEVLSQNDLLKIKNVYEEEGKKEEFLDICNKIEIAVFNKYVDGTITSDEDFEKMINDINQMFKTDNWSLIGLEYPKYWMGTWSLDKRGNVYFEFRDKDLIPDWVKDEDVSKYIIM